MLAETFDKSGFLKSRGVDLSYGDIRRLSGILTKAKDISILFPSGKKAHFQFIQAPGITGKKGCSLVLTIVENEDQPATRVFSRSPQQYVDRLAIGRLVKGIEESVETAKFNSMSLGDPSEALTRFSTTRMASEQVSMHSLDL